jgi:hypothetical protein
VCHIGYLGVGQALEVVQHHGRALRERERSQGIGNRVGSNVALSRSGRLRARIRVLGEEIQ